MQKTPLHYWLALLHAPGIGSSTGRKLLSAFTNIKELFSASKTQLMKLELDKSLIAGITTPKWEQIDKELNWLNEPNHHLLTIEDIRYPPLLKEIPDPPLVIFVNGDPAILTTPQLAMVGSRNPSHIGLDNAFDFAKYLAESGLTITSGLAIGIDTESHKGALAGKGRTIAVMGTGSNKIYPARNKALAKQIVANGGALISELPIDTPPKPENFPYRNRIVSGLSLGTVIIEATIRSGSLITARLAADQGREIFAIPGSIHNPLARGCHQLIRQGAKLVETASDILEELGALDTFRQTKTVTATTTVNTVLDSDYQKLLDYIDYEATAVDVLVERSGLNASEVSSMLLILELNGYITSAFGGYIKLEKK